MSTAVRGEIKFSQTDTEFESKIKLVGLIWQVHDQQLTHISLSCFTDQVSSSMQTTFETATQT